MSTPTKPSGPVGPKSSTTPGKTGSYGGHSGGSSHTGTETHAKVEVKQPVAHTHGAKHPDIDKGKSHPVELAQVADANKGKKKTAAQRLYPGHMDGDSY